MSSEISANHKKTCGKSSSTAEPWRPSAPVKCRSIPNSTRSMDNPSVIYESVIPCPMFTRVRRVSSALDSTSSHATPFCSPFVFIILRIASPVSPLYSHPYKLPGGVPSVTSVLLPLCCAFSPHLSFSSDAQVLPHHTVANSLSPSRMPTPLPSIKSTLFCKNARGGWGPHRPCLVPGVRLAIPKSVQRRHVAACRAGCHNSTLHDASGGTRLPFTTSGIRSAVALLFLGVKHGSPR